MGNYEKPMQIYEIIYIKQKTQVVILDQRNFPGGSKVIDIVLSFTKKSKPGDADLTGSVSGTYLTYFLINKSASLRLLLINPCNNLPPPVT